MVAANTYGRQVVVPLTNKSGGGVIAGDVVIVDTSNNDAFTTTTSAATTNIVGVAQETIASNAVGRVLVQGYAALVLTSGSVTRGNYGATHTVAKQAADVGSSRVSGAFCKFLTGGTTPDAIVWNPDLGGASLTNPMTNVGDIIYGGTAGAPTRLADVAVGSVLKSGGVNTAPAWGQLAGLLLGLTVYAPSAQTIYTSANSVTIADVDATNMIVAFTAPASGNVLVRLGALGDATTDDMYWGVRESTTNLGGGRAVRAGGAGLYTTLSVYITGISAGSHTYKWGFANASASGGTQRLIVQDGIGASHWPPAVLEVWSAA